MLFCCFILPRISQGQRMLKVGVCSPSCNCTSRPSNRSCRFAPQDEATRRANWLQLARHCGARRVLHNIEHAFPSGNRSLHAVDITLTRIQATSWNRCAVPLNDYDERMFRCYEWCHLRLISEQVHWIACALCPVPVLKDWTLYWLSSQRLHLDHIYSTMLPLVRVVILARTTYCCLMTKSAKSNVPRNMEVYLCYGVAQVKDGCM